MQENQVVSLLLEERRKLIMSGVESVDAFSDQGLKLTVSGNKVVILGDKIKVISFNKANGNLVAEGMVNEIKYTKKSMPFIKRIFR